MSFNRFRLSQQAPAPTVVDTTPASPVPTTAPAPGAAPSLCILIEDSDTSSSVISISSEGTQTTSNPIEPDVSPSQPAVDRSIPLRRSSLDTDEAIPTYSTTITARFPLLSVVQANVADYDTACR